MPGWAFAAAWRYRTYAGLAACLLAGVYLTEAQALAERADTSLQNTDAGLLVARSLENQRRQQQAELDRQDLEVQQALLESENRPVRA